MILWWALTAASVVFVIVDIWRVTPEAVTLKWAFVILTIFTGPFGAFFYVLGCREPLRGTHEQYVAARWRQVLGSTMHCAAGDGLGIVVGAALGSVLALNFWSDFAVEYVLGFGFGWLFFQAFAMRSMAGGSYPASLRMTFLPEFLSMNVLMAGMQLTMAVIMALSADTHHPSQPGFWFMMSMSLLVGFMAAYPMNWWLVAHHLKHGMLTVRRDGVEPGPVAAGEHESHTSGPAGSAESSDGAMSAMTVESPSGAATTPAMTARPGNVQLIAVTLLSLAILTAALLVAHSIGM